MSDEKEPDVKRDRSRWIIPWRIYIPRLLLELLVVFVGVYAASAVQQRQQQKRDEADAQRQVERANQRRSQLSEALIREIESITSNTRRVARAFPPMLAQFDSLIDARRYPALEPLIEPVRFENHMWNATLASGGLELFDVPTVYALSSFYNELNEGFATLSQLRDLSERMLLPNADAAKSEFYDLGSGQLRPKYMWYITQQQRLARLARQITEEGDSVVVRLKR